MTAMESWARASAGLLAAAVLLAIGPPLSHVLADSDGLLAAVWNLLRTFTIITNLLFGLTFCWIAWRGTRRVSATIVGGAVLAMILVGVVYNTLLHALPHQTLWDALGDYTHHLFAPIAALLWWAAFAQHGQLRWPTPLVWMCYPLAYCVYIFLRVELTPMASGINSGYPYFFMDVDALGWPTVALNIVGIGAGFALTGVAMVACDKWLGKNALRPAA